LSRARSKYWNTESEYYPTTPLPPFFVEGAKVMSKYQAIEDIIEDLWEYCMELEDQYHHTGNQDVLIKFATALMIVQYWEDLLLSMEGIDVFRVYF